MKASGTLSILVNAYACSPGMGSEPGMAWNWCVNLARYCELHIITEGEFSGRIEKALVPPPAPNGRGNGMSVNGYGLTETQIRNMHFYWNPIGGGDAGRCARIRRMCWNQGDWRFYRYYKEWQWKTYLMAKDICVRKHIDVIHQLNMIGFREPGYLWKIKDIPLVWGPVDAKEKFPVEYLEGASWKQKLFMRLKNAITVWQLSHDKRVRRMAELSSLIISASSNSQSSFKKYFQVESPLINETGCYLNESSTSDKSSKETFDVLWVGKMDFRKQFELAIRAFAMAYHPDLRLHVVGSGDVSSYQKIAENLGIMDLCVWHGAVSHKEVQQIMRQSDLFLFTSVAEGTPHVVLEAIGNNLPVLCFDTCGQGDTINEKVGIKIPLTNPKQSAKDFARQIEYLYKNRDVLKQMSENCNERKHELSWDNKARQMIGLYDRISRN